MRFLIAIYLAIPASAAVDGTVINGSTGKPQAGAIVSLVQPGAQGMQTLGSTKSAVDGKFTIDKRAAAGPQIVQAIYKGVQYNLAIPPNQPATNISVTVYESSDKQSGIQMAQHMILLEPAASQLVVNETMLYNNSSKVTYNDPANGSIRFYLPETAGGKARVSINAPGGMPIQRPAQKTASPNVFKVDYPLKPGETRVDITYSVPVSDPLQFSSKTLEKGSTRIVVPRGVTIEGSDVKSLGTEPNTQAGIYDVVNPAFTIKISGTGSLRSSNGAPTEEEDNPPPSIQAVMPHLYDRFYWILGISLGLLAIGFALLYRNDTSPKDMRR